MLSSALQFILSIIISICNVILSIFISPILALINMIFPSFSDATTVFNQFLNDYLVQGITFSRELFLNITGYPRALLHTLAVIFLAKVTYHLAIIPVKFGYRLISYIFKLPNSSDVVSTSNH